MSDEPDNLVVVYLRRIDTKMDGLTADMVEVKEGLSLLEARYSSISRRTDRLSGDIEQIRRRLDIVPVA